MKKKTKTIIGAWVITVDNGGPSYEGDTSERFEAIKADLLKHGKTFQVVKSFNRRPDTKGSFTLYMP